MALSDRNRNLRSRLPSRLGASRVSREGSKAKARLSKPNGAMVYIIEYVLHLGGLKVWDASFVPQDKLKRAPTLRMAPGALRSARRESLIADYCFCVG
jgi:hypothetical protein